MNKKILVVSRNFWPEDVRINELCEGLVQQGFSIDVLCGQPSDSTGEFFKGYNSFKIRRESHNKIDIYRCQDVKRSGGSNLRIFFYYISFPIFASSLIKKLINKKYEAVLICQYSPVMSVMPGLKIAKKLAIPAYIYVADIWPETVFDVIDVQSTLFRKFLYKLSDRLYKKSDFLIVPTEKMKSGLEQRLIMEKSRIFVVPGSSREYFCCEIRDDSLLEKMAGSFNFTLFHNPEDSLDANTLIKAVLMIRHSGIKNIRFIITGVGDDIKNLWGRVQEDNLYEYFFFEGDVKNKDIGKYIHLTDAVLYVNIPREAGEYDLAQSFVNCLAAARPIIVNCEGAAKDVVRSSRCGLAAAPMDADNLYGCMMKIYHMPESERLEMGYNARAYRQENFDYETNVQKMADILNGLPVAEPYDDSGIKNISEM